MLKETTKGSMMEITTTKEETTDNTITEEAEEVTMIETKIKMVEVSRRVPRSSLPLSRERSQASCG
jgi:hypothetical protein